LEVAHRRKEEVRIVPKGLSEKAEHLLMQVVILGDAYQREDVPRRILVKSTAVGEDEYEAAAKELVEAGLAESVDSDYGSLRATLAGKERVRGPRKPASEAVGRRRGMYARVSTVEASPAKLDEATHFFGQQVLPQLQQMDGFKGFIVLGDRQRGKLFGVALWESEEVMHSTEEVVSRRRGGIPHPPGGATVDEENYEVFILEVSS
jgi:ABC-type phosphate transport system auxiliary subunit